MSIDAMKQALEALEMLARYENPETKIQVRKPKNGGPIVTMYPHKVATEAAQSLRLAIEQAEKQEPLAWKNAAIRLGEELSSVGPDGYYDMSAKKWLDWAMNQQPRGKNSLPAPPQRQPHELLCVCGASWSIDSEGNEELLSTPPQRQPLTRKDVLAIIDSEPAYMITGLPMFYRDQVAIIVRKVERAHGIAAAKEKS